MTRFGGILLLVWLLLLVSFPVPSLALTISELLYDAEGPDNGKVFVELFGASGTSLEGFTLEAVNGADGAVGPVLFLSGEIPADGFFVLADLAGESSEVPGADLLANFDLQNGPDSLLLRAPDGSVVDAIGYGIFGAADVFAGEGQPAPDASSGQSLARHSPDLDTDDNAEDFGILATPTPGFGPTSVPEPHGVLLLAGALAGLSAACRKRGGTPPGL